MSPLKVLYIGTWLIFASSPPSASLEVLGTALPLIGFIQVVAVLRIDLKMIFYDKICETVLCALFSEIFYFSKFYQKYFVGTLEFCINL